MAKKSTETILVLVVACVILYLMAQRKYFLSAAVVLGIIGVFIPFLADKIHWAWMKLGHGMGYITSRIILITVFFIILYPLALMARLFRKGSLKIKPGNSSYFKDRNFIYTKEDMENTW